MHTHARRDCHTIRSADDPSYSFISASPIRILGFAQIHFSLPGFQFRLAHHTPTRAMKLTNLVLFALSSVSVAFGQTAGAAPANDALALVSKCNNDLQAGPPGEITSKLTGLTAEIKSLCSALQADPEMGLEMRSKIAVQMATMIKYVAHEGMSVGPGALGGNMQSALKALLEEMRVCVPGVDKETSRV
ncbi:hypothetical protein AG1IA_02927 [Rhizoctonia solani AG-1 IA]|uniref:Uncharacterized protein n=1 Tax=Thanatephorus cucumeris (strain AG1-IA) TaxID=983506 RepID=L8X342_THACA|nr:hypothetical protein AG1IA_02927 [Rhizoctonia solani AG-1 IA]